MDILQPAWLPVEKVLSAAVAVAPPHDLDLVKFRPKLLFAIGEQQGHLAHLGGPARFCALKDHVLHLAPAQRLWALLAQRPTYRVGDVRLAASVGSPLPSRPVQTGEWSHRQRT